MSKLSDIGGRIFGDVALVPDIIYTADHKTTFKVVELISDGILIITYVAHGARIQLSDSTLEQILT